MIDTEYLKSINNTRKQYRMRELSLYYATSESQEDYDYNMVDYREYERNTVESIRNSLGY